MSILHVGIHVIQGYYLVSLFVQNFEYHCQYFVTCLEDQYFHHQAGVEAASLGCFQIVTVLLG